MSFFLPFCFLIISGHYQHTFTPFEEVLRVPLVISYPRLLLLSPVRVVEGLSWHMDLVPTILAFAGISRPVRAGALNLVPVMVGEGEIPADRTVVPMVMLPLEAPGKEALRRVAIRGNLKFIEGHESFGDAEGLLFDLNESPGESTNLRTSRTMDFVHLAETARRYEEKLERHPPIHLETGEPFWPEMAGKTAPIELPAENRERLRALGYFE